MNSPGGYSRQPAAEVEALLEDYLAADEWEEITASESPQALEATVVAARKRSGEYAITPREREATEVVHAIRKCSGE